MRILVVGDFQGVFPVELKRKIAKEKIELIVGVGDYGGIRNWRPYFREMFKKMNKTGEYLSAEEYFGKAKYKKLLKKDERATRKVLSYLNGLGKPLIFVFGNTDDEWYNYPFDKIEINKRKRRFVKRLKNMEEITYSIKKFNGINFVGFGGYVDTDYMAGKKSKEDGERLRRRMKRRAKSRKRLFELLRKAKGEKILVLHYPPKGVFDIIKDKGNPYDGKSSGIGFFRDAIRKYKPRLVLCGHMHEYQGAKRIGKTIVVNPGDAEKGKYAIVSLDKEVRVKFAR